MGWLYLLGAAIVLALIFWAGVALVYAGLVATVFVDEAIRFSIGTTPRLGWAIVGGLAGAAVGLWRAGRHEDAPSLKLGSLGTATIVVVALAIAFTGSVSSEQGKFFWQSLASKPVETQAGLQQQFNSASSASSLSDLDQRLKANLVGTWKSNQWWFYFGADGSFVYTTMVKKDGYTFGPWVRQDKPGRWVIHNGQLLIKGGLSEPDVVSHVLVDVLPGSRIQIKGMVGPANEPAPEVAGSGTARGRPTSGRGAGSMQADFVSVSPGEFVMGCSSDDTSCSPNERPAHPVKIIKGFEIGKYEVTQAQWTAVMGSNPSRFKAPNLPVESISWKDVQVFLVKLNASRDGFRYRLPTEQEWEYAARAGTTGAYWGSGAMDRYDPKTFFDSRSVYRQQTRPVGQKRPNPWGLYDTLGNVWEWTQDPWSSDYSADPQPEASDKEEGRVLRGGPCYNGVSTCATRVSERLGNGISERNVSMGFRAVREAQR